MSSVPSVVVHFGFWIKRQRADCRHIPTLTPLTLTLTRIRDLFRSLESKSRSKSRSKSKSKSRNLLRPLGSTAVDP